MSIATYRQNVSRGYVGNRPVCLVAAFEQISPHFGYSRDAYDGYEEFANWYSSFPVKERDRLIGDYEDEVSRLVAPLGGLSCEDMQFSRATTLIGFLRIMRPLLEEGTGVIVDVGMRGHTVHSVGVLPVGHEIDHVTLVSSHVPKMLTGVISLPKLFQNIAIPEDTGMRSHPLNNANIMVLPIL